MCYATKSNNMKRLVDIINISYSTLYNSLALFEFNVLNVRHPSWRSAIVGSCCNQYRRTEKQCDLVKFRSVLHSEVSVSLIDNKRNRSTELRGLNFCDIT